MTDAISPEKPPEPPKEPRPWVRAFLADPLAYHLLNDYSRLAVTDSPGALVERFRAWADKGLAEEPERLDIVWLALARAQLDQKLLLAEVRGQALAAASTVFGHQLWEDTPEFDGLRKDHVSALKRELEASPTVEDNLPEEERAWNRAMGYGMANEHEQVLALSRQSQERWPGNEDFIILEAQALGFLDRPGEALEVGRAALRRDLKPAARLAYLRLLGSLHLFLERRQQATGARLGVEGDSAIQYFTEAHAMVPGDSDTRRRLLEALLQVGKGKQALGHIEYLLGEDPEDPWLWKQKSLVLGDLGKRKEADEALFKSLFYGGDVEVLARQGLVFLRQGKHEDAERCLRQALDLAPDYPWAKRMLSINRMAREGGVTGFMIRQEIFWADKVAWRYALFMGSWFGAIALACALINDRNSPILLWILGGGGALMLAGLYLPEAWLVAARWVYDRELMREERRAQALEWNLKTFAQVAGGVLIAGGFIYLRESGIVPKKGAGLFDGMEYLLGPLLPLLPWLAVHQVLSNRRQKFSQLSKLDWFLLALASASLACLLPLLFTKDTSNPRVWIPAAAGGLVLFFLAFGMKAMARKGK